MRIVHEYQSQKQGIKAGRVAGESVIIIGAYREVEGLEADPVSEILSGINSELLTMDTLRLEPFPDPDNKDRIRYNIFINDTNFIDLVREIERPVWEKEGNPNPGNYIGFDDYSLRNYLDSYITDGKMYILACGGCGDDGCWSIIVQITITGNTISWNNFYNPQRPPFDFPAESWDHMGLGPFVFDKDQYVAEFTRARKDLGGFIPKPQRHPYYSKL